MSCPKRTSFTREINTGFGNCYGGLRKTKFITWIWNPTNNISAFVDNHPKAIYKKIQYIYRHIINTHIKQSIYV